MLPSEYTGIYQFLYTCFLFPIFLNLCYQHLQQVTLSLPAVFLSSEIKMRALSDRESTHWMHNREEQGAGRGAQRERQEEEGAAGWTASTQLLATAQAQGTIL